MWASDDCDFCDDGNRGRDGGDEPKDFLHHPRIIIIIVVIFILIVIVEKINGLKEGEIWSRFGYRSCELGHITGR